MNSRINILITFFITLLLTVVEASDNVRFFTSDGVVYSYAVITSTIRPATVIVETLYYTTTRVQEVTLSNNIVTSITEEVTSTSVSSSTSTITSRGSSSSVETSPSIVITTATSQATSTVEPISTTAKTTLIPLPADEVEGNQNSPSPSLAPSSNISSSSSATSTTSTSSSLSAAVTSSASDVCGDDDDYYVTYYITGTNDSIDAASTITSTKTTFVTITA